MQKDGKEYRKSTLSGKHAERLTLNGSPLKKCAKAEPEFLEQLVLMLTRWNPQAVEPELTNWGGWWRKRFRENADKARRVLAEELCLVKEGRITRSPGSAAMDLWKRLP